MTEAEKIIKQCKADADSHVSELPDFLTPQEKSIEYFKYGFFRVCDQLKAVIGNRE